MVNGGKVADITRFSKCGHISISSLSLSEYRTQISDDMTNLTCFIDNEDDIFPVTIYNGREWQVPKHLSGTQASKNYNAIRNFSSKMRKLVEQHFCVDNKRDHILVRL